MESKITFIGAGNMARAIIGGLLSRGQSNDNLAAADPSAESLQAVADRFDIRTYADNEAAARNADIVVLAVKPQVIDEVASSIVPALDDDTLIISVAAGIPVARLEKTLGRGHAIVRVMPNTPALYGAGATGLYAAPACSEQQRTAARSLFEAVGTVVEIEDESLMDVVTAISGSGPAYFFALTEALTEAGIKAGLDAEQARRLACQTAAGAGTMLAEHDADAGQLRRQVTSPGGTTAAALEALEQADFNGAIQAAVEAAIRRGREMGNQ
ncbi:MAG: pyrroline-5-carboxylate reductase [Wenzhouxiangellaceae bacterium]|nr:pyrroline-5-carboxylate reductase [Wenzhouxiangellaceae bacterium]